MDNEDIKNKFLKWKNEEYEIFKANNLALKKIYINRSKMQTFYMNYNIDKFNSIEEMNKYIKINEEKYVNKKMFDSFMESFK